MPEEDSGGSVDDSVRARIDMEVSGEGFVFFKQLQGYGNYFLYFNEDKTIRRTYHPETGELIEEKVVGCGRKGSEKFLHPVENSKMRQGSGTPPPYTSEGRGKWR